MNLTVLRHSLYVKDENGRILAEVSFPETSPGVYSIENVYVNDRYIGTKIPGQLMQAAIDHIRQQGGRAEAGCPYAKRYFADHRIS